MNEDSFVWEAPPVILTVAGSDCSAGAGLQTDIKTAQAMGVYALSAVTCVVSEMPGQVRSIQEMEPGMVADQVRLCLGGFPVKAIKTGMLYSPPIVSVLAAELHGKHIPLIVDPVMIATAGSSLMKQEAIAVYESELIPLASLLTPNLDEATALLGTSPLIDLEQMEDAAADMVRRYHCAVLLKGGHLTDDCHDVLMTSEGVLHKWSRPKVKDVVTHGTGCTLSAAITSGLALGKPLEKAVEDALDYVAGAIANHYRWLSPRQVDALHV
ncbi:MAG: bifunctional hydroxymethylpyrimidine kinase/phosphomethylpyrimidine kinase [Akkermansia sp.]